MQKASWNGQSLYAYEVAEDFDFETVIRKASVRKQLLCEDPGCKTPIVRYCNGGEKEPFFAHLINSGCDYCKYEKKSASTIPIMKKVAQILKSKGYNIDIENKLIPGHITQITADLDLNNKVAVDFISRQKGVFEIEGIAREYTLRNIDYTFVVADDSLILKDETRAFFAKRYALNKYNLLMISFDGSKVKQIALDVNNYGIYKNRRCVFPLEYQSDYFAIARMTDCLVFENNHLTTPKFEKLFTEWLQEKKDFYEKWKKQVDKAEEDAAIAEAKRLEEKRLAEEIRKKEEEKREAERLAAEAEELISQEAIKAEIIIDQETLKAEREQKKEELFTKEHPKLLKVMEIIKNSSKISGRFQYKSTNGFVNRKVVSQIYGVNLYKDKGILVEIDNFVSLLLFVQEGNLSSMKDYSGVYFISIDLKDVQMENLKEELRKYIELS